MCARVYVKLRVLFCLLCVLHATYAGFIVSLCVYVCQIYGFQSVLCGVCARARAFLACLYVCAGFKRVFMNMNIDF